METAGKTRKKADELLPEMPAGPVASEVRRPALLEIEPLPDVTGLNDRPIPIAAKVNELVAAVNALVKQSKERE
jgi:hypothetical protein